VGAVIGTNRDLNAIQRMLDFEIIQLKQQLAGSARDEVWISNRLAVVCRQRVAVCATLANRRIEATRQAVDLSRWLTGNGALFGSAVNRAGAERAGAGPTALSTPV
jgi:hypothetical protein